VTSLSPPAAARVPTALALGTFDGLHAGHRRVIQEAIGLAREDARLEPPSVPTVVSFWPHPREVLYGDTRLRLDLPEEKLALLEPLGVAQLVMLPFTRELAALSPERFVVEVLLGQLEARGVAVGENFRFGARRAGDAADLVRLGRRHGIRVTVVPTLHDGGGRVSSSRIRQALAEGKIAVAEALLGRPYRFTGAVVKGRGLARQLGWPTANLEVRAGKFLPMEGVYASLVWIGTPSGDDRGASRGPLAGGFGEGPLAAVMNLGRQPTVDPEAASVPEVHLLDQELDLQGRDLLVQPLRWLRGQRRFADLAALSSQIGMDVEVARQHCLSLVEAR
jgi:riboflavin kinase/FMN adenylyltransferase